ncbi:AsmA family protein [Undibacterium seohonense]|uniref:AsmA family protein n=1 Tax=Undibacterium seohonense TaxID=1344950 RepID=A0ABR6X575_9BURK|nr:AsmA family protein [Undibacterium seohonense]MBC3808085.1 AsmA family protein [Undibacterium seohonense]
MKLRTKTKVLPGIITLLILVPAIALIVLLTFDWNRAKPRFNSSMSEALGRPFQIRGELRLQWTKPTPNFKPNAKPESNNLDKTWHRFIPWPQFFATDIHIANPADFQQQKSESTVKKGETKDPVSIGDQIQDETASIKEVSFSLNPWKLLHKEISIPTLRLSAPLVHLQRHANGANNWTIRKPAGTSLWRLDLQQIALTDGTIYLQDAVKHADIKVGFNEDRSDPEYSFTWNLSGKLNDEAIVGEGQVGAVLALTDQTKPFPIRGYLRQDQTIIALTGTLTRPMNLMAIQMRLAVAALSMAKLYAISGIFLPETPPFSTEGQLTGDINASGGKWNYSEFRGKVGSSDISGDLQFEFKSPRPLLSGAIVSKSLLFSDLAPIIGIDSRSSKQTRGLATVQPSNKILPIESFKTDRWKSIDANVKFSADHIIRSETSSITKLMTNLNLHDGVLSLKPLNFEMAGGSLRSDIRLDGSQNHEKNAIVAQIQVQARRLQLKQIMPFVKDLDASLGEINGNASLSAVGNSIATLLGSSNGELRAVINRGTVSKLLLEKIGLNIGSIVLTILFGDEEVKLNCLAAHFSVQNGLMQSKQFVVDTEQSRLNLQGTINLRQERLDLKITQKSKGIRLISLRAPIYVRGSFQHPTTKIDKGVVALRAGAAIALAALAPVAAFIPLVNSGSIDSPVCEEKPAVKSRKSK